MIMLSSVPTLSKWQREGKGPAPAEGKDRRPVDGDGKPVEKLKLPDTSGLKGGVRTRNDFLSREQMTEIFNIVQNIPSNHRTRDQNKIVLLVAQVDRS